ncbi:hypothetical protein [Mesobacillus subterraneus]|uniref:Uncharacterized protein n=1 Tax=Mesobacillus subterraneus TaxID=285983 RepID=A0A427TWS7_9BACI|nr:hypothetical protein [Mesobacillus subterraneus]RSD28605.1 hypothetical protein EJA10_03230 [Mesobacillus subterraneus]
MLIRKIVSALLTTVIMVILYSLPESIGLGLFFGMYLLPILLIYGIPASILSDMLTMRSSGYPRMATAALIHIFPAALFVAIPTFIEQGNLLTGLWSNAFFLLSAVISSFIFWCFDELMKSKRIRGKCLGVFKRIGDLRI